MWPSLHGKRLILCKNGHRESIQSVKTMLCRHPTCLYCIKWEFSHFSNRNIAIFQKWAWPSLHGKWLILGKIWHRESIQRVKKPYLDALHDNITIFNFLGEKSRTKKGSGLFSVFRHFRHTLELGTHIILNLYNMISNFQWRLTVIMKVHTQPALATRVRGNMNSCVVFISADSIWAYDLT